MYTTPRIALEIFIIPKHLFKAFFTPKGYFCLLRLFAVKLLTGPRLGVFNSY